MVLGLVASAMYVQKDLHCYKIKKKKPVANSIYVLFYHLACICYIFSSLISHKQCWSLGPYRVCVSLFCSLLYHSVNHKALLVVGEEPCSRPKPMCDLSGKSKASLPSPAIIGYCTPSPLAFLDLGGLTSGISSAPLQRPPPGGRG